jgi:hypothetical protein
LSIEKEEDRNLGHRKRGEGLKPIIVEQDEDRNQRTGKKKREITQGQTK